MPFAEGASQPSPQWRDSVSTGCSPTQWLRAAEALAHEAMQRRGGGGKRLSDAIPVMIPVTVNGIAVEGQ